MNGSTTQTQYTLKYILETAEKIGMALTGPGYNDKQVRNLKSNYIHAMRREFEKTSGKQNFETVEIFTLALISEILTGGANKTDLMDISKKQHSNE